MLRLVTYFVALRQRTCSGCTMKCHTSPNMLPVQVILSKTVISCPPIRYTSESQNRYIISVVFKNKANRNCVPEEGQRADENMNVSRPVGN